MFTQYSDATLTAGMAWFHLATILVPLILATVYLDWRDWRQSHPRSVRRQSIQHLPDLSFW